MEGVVRSLVGDRDGLASSRRRSFRYRSPATYRGHVCRNITELRGLEPPATDDEITAAARQYVRKVSGILRPTDGVAEAFEAAVAEVAASTLRLLNELPQRRQPPKSVPPLRRPEVRARLGLQ